MKTKWIVPVLIGVSLLAACTPTALAETEINLHSSRCACRRADNRNRPARRRALPIRSTRPG